MRDKVINKRNSYLDPSSGERVQYKTTIEAQVASGPLSYRTEYHPPIEEQTTDFGIDRFDLKIPRVAVDESRIRFLCSSLLGIRVGGQWARISMNRELVDQTKNYRTKMVEVMWELFQRGLLIVPKSSQRDGRVKKTLTDVTFSEVEAFNRIVDMVTFDSVEVFFDHATDIRKYVDGKQYLHRMKETIYSKDFRKTPMSFFQKKSLLKVYDKVECKSSKQEAIFDFEEKTPYRVEFTLHKARKATMTWKAFDCDNHGLLEILGEDLSTRIDEVCPEIRSLIEVEGVHEQLKTLLRIPPKKKLKFDRAKRTRRTEGKTSLVEDLKRMIGTIVEVTEKILGLKEYGVKRKYRVSTMGCWLMVSFGGTWWSLENKGIQVTKEDSRRSAIDELFDQRQVDGKSMPATLRRRDPFGESLQFSRVLR